MRRKTQARLNKYLIYILFALIFVIAFFALSKTNIVAFAEDKAPVVVSTEDVLTEYTFNGEEQTVTGFKVDNDETVLRFENNTFINVPENGKQTVTYWADATENYEAVPRTTFEVTVHKAATVIYTFGVETTYTYNTNFRTVNSGATTNQIATNISVAEIIYSNNTFQHVPEGGRQTINIYTEETRNYLAASTEVEILILPAQIEGSIFDVETIYGEPEATLDFEVTGLLGSDTKEGLGITLERAPGKDIGEYAITKSGQTNNDYEVNLPDGIYKILSKPITLIVDDKESAYKEDKKALSVSLKDGHTLVDGDDLDMLDVLYEAINDTYAGTYPIIAYQGEGKNPNYQVTFEGSYGDGKGTYTISKISRTIEKAPNFKEIFKYNGVEQTVTGVMFSEPDPAGDPELVFVGNKFTNVPANGQLSFTVSAEESRNFFAVLETTFTVTVNKIDVTVEIESKEREYKSADVDLTYKVSTATPLANGENHTVLNISLETEATFSSNAGIYPITATYNNSNYNVTFTGSYDDGNQNKGKYTITKASIYIIVEGKQTIYGQDVSLTYKIDENTPLKEGDTKEYLNIVLERDAGKDVGIYDIRYVSGNDTNYDIEYDDSEKYRISEKHIIVQINDKEKIYHTPDVDLDFSIDQSTPLAYEETKDILKVILTRDEGEDVNVYRIFAEQAENKSLNYIVSFVGSYGDGQEGKGKYIIKKAQITLDVDGVETHYVYTGNLQIVDTGAVVSEQYGIYKSEVQYSNNTFTTVSEGNGKKVRISVAENPNYLGVEKIVTLTVDKAETVITTSGLTAVYTYNGVEQTVLGKAFTNHIGINTVINFENHTFTDVPGNVEGEDYGTQIVKLSTLETENYKAGSQDFEITIYKRETSINVDLIPKEYTYELGVALSKNARINHGETSELTYENAEITAVPTNVLGENYGTQIVKVSVGATQNYTAAEVEFEIKINKGKQIIDTSLIKTQYSSLNDTFPIKIEPGSQYGYATVEDDSQEIAYQNNIFYTKEELDANGVVIITAVGNQNYIEVQTTIKLVIDKKVPIFNFDNVIRQYTYTGELQTIDSGVTLDEGTDYQRENITYSNNAFTTVNEGNTLQIKVSVPADGEYVEYSATFTIEVLKAETTITLLDDRTYTYNGEEQVAEGFAYINHSEGTITYANNTFISVAEGNALNVSIIVAETDNYKSALMENVKINVEKAETIINTSLVKLEYIYNGEEQIVGGASLNHTENAEIIYENNKFTTVNEGNGKVVLIKATETANYYPSQTTVTIVVNKATYDMSNVGYSDKEVDYNGQLHEIKISGQLPQGVWVNYSSHGETEAGTYTMTANFFGDPSNYNLIPSMDATLTIKKISYDFSNYTFLNAQKIYNGLEQNITFEGEIPVGYDGSSPVIEYEGSLKDVGSIDIVANITSTSPNYEIIVPQYTARLTINKKAIDIVKSPDKIYSSSYENVDTVELDAQYYVIEGLCEGDSITLTYEAEFEDKSAIGKALVKMLITAIGNANYELPTMPYEVEIDAAIIYPIELEIDEECLQDLIFDNTSKEVRVTATIGGKDISEENIHIEFRQGTNVYSKAVDAGEYIVEITAEDEYAGTLTITKELFIEKAYSEINLIGNFNQTYANFEEFTAELQVDADDGLPKIIDISYSFNTDTPIVGAHSVTARFAGSKNYEPSEVSVHFYVTALKVDLTFRDDNKYPYTGESQKVEYTLSQQHPNDEDIVLVTYGANSPKELGEYGIHYELNNTNYEIVNVYGPQTIIIKKATLTVSVKPIKATAKQKINFEYDIDGFVAGDTESVLKSMPQVEKDIFETGVYTIEPFGASAENYDFVYIPYDLVVYQNNLVATITGEGSFSVTGLYDESFKISIQPVSGTEFFDSLFKISNVLENAYKIEVTGDGEMPQNARLIYENPRLKSSILNRAYFITESGEKIKLSSSDIKDGKIEAKFNGKSGYVVIYKNYTIIYIAVIAFVTIVAVVLYLTAPTGRRGSPKRLGLRKNR
ncbi:MAG TPA: hypothetical protein GX709_01500 [Clostridiales bacterium]|nr:hypothetical protein [Clostridiales bacterium]